MEGPVVIIGAGLAGLQVAESLRQQAHEELSLALRLAFGLALGPAFGAFALLHHRSASAACAGVFTLNNSRLPPGTRSRAAFKAAASRWRENSPRAICCSTRGALATTAAP